MGLVHRIKVRFKARSQRIHAQQTQAAYNEAWRLSGNPFRQRTPAHPRLPRKRLARVWLSAQ
jgi:hypothetical protein